MLRISIGDNDFNFIMEQCMNYLSGIYACYKKDNPEIKVEDVFVEFLTEMHVKDNIKDYILNRLSVKHVDGLDDYFTSDNGCSFYFNGKSVIKQ